MMSVEVSAEVQALKAAAVEPREIWELQELKVSAVKRSSEVSTEPLV